MKKIITTLLLAFSTFASADNVIVNGTRFIYPSSEKEISIQLTNKATRPALIQTWLDNGNPEENPDTISTPFLITPPILKIDGKSGQTLRIRGVNTSIIPTDHESIWWLNVLEIPPTNVSPENADKNTLQLAIRSRFKFIYRPVNLVGRNEAPQQLQLVAGGSKLTITNPTPFYITISKISRNGDLPLNTKTVMLSPKSSETVSLKASVSSNEKLMIDNVNDYGTDVGIILTTK